MRQYMVDTRQGDIYSLFIAWFLCMFCDIIVPSRLEKGVMCFVGDFHEISASAVFVEIINFLN